MTKKPKGGWWGEGPAPWVKWPGVTIQIEAKWVAARDRWESPNGKYYFDEQAANDVSIFFSECLTHHKGEFAGKPFILADWQELLVIRPVFGWKHVATGLRRFRKVYVEIPKKNGKSQLCAGLGLYMTFCDGEMGSEVYCAAADREQASIVFEEAKAMVEDCDELLDRADVFKRSIVFSETRSVFKVLSADAKTKHGPNIHCLIFDELHAQPNRDLFETLEKGIASRLQPLIVMITTAGDDQESICYEQHEYAMSVMKDGGDDSFLSVVFSTSKDVNWTEEKNWFKVNPGLGTTVKLDYFRNEVASALKEVRKVNNFKRLHLNIWTQQSKLWIPIEKWDECKTEFLPVEELAQLPKAIGMDLSSKIDLSAVVVAFKHYDPPDVEPILIELKDATDEEAEKEAKDPERGNHRKLSINFSVTLMPYFWMPEDSLTERKKTDRFGYDVMKEQGLIELTEGNIIDYDAIYDKICGLSEIYHLKDCELAFDPWNATQLSTQLHNDGFKTVEIPQTFAHLSEASKVFEALVRSGRIRHSGHRVLRWNVENVAVKEDPSGNIKPVKSSAMKRIDGVLASVLAVGRLMVHKEDSGPVAMWV